MSWFQQYFILLILQSPSARGEADLTLRSNPGLHAFTYYGAFADDISFGKLVVTINTKQIVKAAVSYTHLTLPTIYPV